MLEWIFQGLLEWLYGQLVEIWEFIAESLLDIMDLDFAYLQSHIPVIGQMSQVLLAVGWALLLGNLVFQALKSMAAGLGFEGEDPKLLFSRTFVFAFLLMASPQICRIGLDLTTNVMGLLRGLDATDVKLIDKSMFRSLGAAWLLAIICSLIVMFKVLKLLIELAERYVILVMLTITAPLAFAMGGSRNTALIFSGWCRMFGSMCLLMVTNLVCVKMLFSVVSTVPSGLDVLPWIALIFAIVKVAHKSDAIITRIGLNPAITGGSGRTLPGTLAYTVARTAVNQMVKGVGAGVSGGKTAQPAASGVKPGGARFNGSRFAGVSYGGQNTREQNTAQQRTTQQAASQQNTSNLDGGWQSGTEHTSGARPAPTGSSSNRTGQSGSRIQQSRETRRSSAPFGARQSPGHVPPSGGAAQASGAAGTRLAPGQPGAPAAKQPGGARSGPAGTAASSHSVRSTHSTAQTAGGTVVNSSARTNIAAGGPKAQPASAWQQSRPDSAAGSAAAPKPGEIRSSGREKPDAVLRTAAVPSPGAAHPGPVGTADRSTRVPPAGGVSSPARQERAGSVSPNSAARGPARQEPRKPAAPTSPSLKGRAPNLRPGPAGIAQTGKQASDMRRPAKHVSKRARSARRPPSRSRGGSSRE